MFRPVFGRVPAFSAGAAFALLLASLASEAPAQPRPGAEADASAPGRAVVIPPRPSDTALVLVDSVPAAARSRTDSLDSARAANPASAWRRPAPDSTWRWPANPRARACDAPLESLQDCWRGAPGVALRQTGFPGIRAGAIDLRTLEGAPVRSHYQPALNESQYGTGGRMPFDVYEERNGFREAWAPVQPLDTPVTDLHWTRGALFLNQFTFSLQRMVGNRAYLGFDYHSDGAESMFYEYPFNVHQPYLGGLGRDSSSLVIADTSHFIMARQLRPRLGFWLDKRTVLEAHADFFLNRTSMARPTNPAALDSTQSLYASSFSASAFGATLARVTDAGVFSLTGQHASWGRRLVAGAAPPFREGASGLVDRFAAEWSAASMPGMPRARLEIENTFHDGAFRFAGADSAASPAVGARADRERFEAEARPSWGLLTADLRGEGARRARADGEVEWLGGGEAGLSADLPLGFEAAASAGAAREGAPDDLLFRWQPALGLYPNAGLSPRTTVRYGASAGWKSRHLGLGAGWDRSIFRDNWLPRVLPSFDPCLVDSASYADLSPAQVCPDFQRTPDSLALARVNYEREARDVAHVSLFLALGNWSLDVRHSALLANRVRDPRLGFTGRNREVPDEVNKGRLLWKRRVLDGKLGLRTQWDWEWFSERYVFASDLDGRARAIKLDEYLALDFTASMEIRSFLLYFRAMNLNHDRYATEPGVHPPGVNFRFGVDWRIRN